MGSNALRPELNALVMTSTKRTLTSEILLTDDQLKAIGCLALESNFLEFQITRMIVEYCGEDMAELLLGQKMIQAKAELLKGVFRPLAIDDDHARRFDLIYGDIADVIPKRNTTIHGEWGSDTSIAQWFLLFFDKPKSSNPAARRNTTVIRASEVMALAHRFGEIQRRLGDWHEELRAHWRSQKQRRPRTSHGKRGRPTRRQSRT